LSEQGRSRFAEYLTELEKALHQATRATERPDTLSQKLRERPA
jgi:hypothetical protein